MNERPSTELDAFEERLLAELKTVASGPTSIDPALPARRREPRRWLLPAAAAAAAVAVASAVVVARPTPAYAVSGGNGAEVKVKVNRLEGADALEAALRERGIPADITYLPTDRACRPGRYTEVRTPGLTLEVRADLFEVTIPAGAVGEGNTFVLSAAVTPMEHGLRATVDFAVAQGPVAECTVVEAR
ncbi:hypothetical protein Kisp01_58940 [Kineosporia sp. NBRC 101677]|uniref:hypothetical protein n=1 Tax=Kineosporia sp. NBRC 101677 TaxID=3032197 RepID=UPI0024A427D0|nr:hypothetical protein [Kineosporia sp. NBRC 101677]GLY18880.1 hypothetical protein Kisp01_58940 [Kineosporia sp. NBRC 101677]